jgi:glycosyltransferase involved in cell wall biosynthesis
LKIMLHLPLSPYSGYGKDGIGLARALVEAGVDVYLSPTEVQAPLPEDIAILLTKPTQAPFDVIITHVDPMRTKATEELRGSTDMLIGWTMWEWSSLANAKGRSKFKENYRDFDALLAYDEVTKGALAEYYKGPIHVLQGGFDPTGWEPVERDFFEDDFYFIQIGVLSPRKNPVASITAFQRAREQDEQFRKHARLSMKTNAPGLHSKWQDLFVDEEDGEEKPKLRIFYDVWPEETVKKFYESGHVLLAPSRGEGKNLPALEFMSTGGPVIATDWGGHKQWLSDEYAYAIDYTLQPFDYQQPKALCAEVDVDHMASLMLHAFHNRAEIRQKGETAARIIPKNFSWDAVVERLFYTIAKLPGGVEVREQFIAGQREDEDE